MAFQRHTREQLESLANNELVDYTMELEERLAQDSSNSSKPPSQDDAQGREKRKKKRKDKSLRKSGERKVGGQQGHPGATLQAREQADVEVDLRLDECPHCQQGLDERDLTGAKTQRQVLDLPEPQPLKCTQYNALEYECQGCGRRTHAPFPEGVNAPIQYGSRLCAWLVTMKDELLLPFKRIETFFGDLLDAPISVSTIDEARKRVCGHLEEWEKSLIEKLIGEDVLGADESGLRVNQSTHWLHVACPPSLTHDAVHEKRGQEAMDAIGILPRFEGRLIHDYLGAYLKYTHCEHGLCNQHHLRDLQAVEELGGQSWSGQMAELLREMLRRRHEHEAKGTLPSSEEIGQWIAKYDQIVQRGEAENPLPPPPPPGGPKKRGRKKKGKARNLVERFRDKVGLIVAFFQDFRVPFTNNQAEQDIRMLKVQQKVSGCFRTKEGAQRFARIRSYLSTMRKQQENLFEALKAAVEGSPKKLPDS